MAMAATEARRNGSRLEILCAVVLGIFVVLGEGFVCVCEGVVGKWILRSEGMKCFGELLRIC